MLKIEAIGLVLAVIFVAVGICALHTRCHASDPLLSSVTPPGGSLLALARAATAAVEALLSDAAAKVRERVVLEGRPAARLLDREQRATHGLAWLATYVEAVRQLTAYAGRMQERGLLSEIEELIVRIGLGEYLAQIQGGIPISQGEIVRPADLGLSAAAVAARMTPMSRR